jgi:hypothetical protein
MKNFVLIVGAFLLSIRLSAQQQVVVDPPDGRGPLTLAALYDSAAGQNALAYAGKPIPPVIRVLPGNAIMVRYVNELPKKSNEQCATGHAATRQICISTVCMSLHSTRRMTCSG